MRDGRLVRERLPSYPGDGPKDYEVPLYVHDVKKNESRVVSFEEARSFRLNTADKSPDGFWIGKESGTRHSRMSILLGRGRSGRKMNVVLEGEYPNYFSFQSLGWIEEPIRP